MASDSSVTIDVRLPDGWAEGEMRDDIVRAFSNRPIQLTPKWLYDDRGSDLFDQITRLDEYYQTEAERSVLMERSAEIAAATGADTIIELGSGTSDKTRTLLDAFHATGQLRRFVPVDVSHGTLVDAAHMLAERYPGIEVSALVGDFTRHLGHLPPGDRRLVAFLGGTIGNFYVEERSAFLGALADHLNPGEHLLLGVDLVKPIDRILASYNDSAGVTADFIANVLGVLNTSFDADFDLDAFDYVPMWDAREERVDMRLRSQLPQAVRIEALDLDVALGEGDEIRVEISTKFRQERLSGELQAAGFELVTLWTDAAEDFGLALARKV
ncbi:MAG: L-histidine N(alpha)-methyltransferase [Actinomycetota bacterium]